MNLFKQFPLMMVLLSLFIPSVYANTLVAVDKVQRGNVPQTLKLTGNIVAAQQVALGNEVAGKVEKVEVEVGDHVTQGQVLLRLRDDDTRWQLQQAQSQLNSDLAQVELAELDQKRLQQLLTSKATPKESYDKAVAQLKMVHANVATRKAEIARINDRLQRHVIKAPFAGLITQRMAEKGSWLGEGDDVFFLTDTKKLRLELLLPQRYYKTLKKQPQQVHVRLQRTGSLDTEEAHIERIIGIVNRQRSFAVWITLNNDQQQWIPGMSASAELRWQDATAQLHVEEDALIRRADGSVLVWKAEATGEGEYKAVAVPVRLGHSYKGRTEVHSAQLKVGDNVVTRGNELLKPQQKLKLSPPLSSNKQEP
ncbi:MAG: efflux RND transporter periplasmic adaptor subunit [Pseudomonadales bacterium]|nr:efflux RND transporter periplasmic adaptor subunit [Pseudomonadales bacterium]